MRVRPLFALWCAVLIAPLHAIFACPLCPDGGEAFQTLSARVEQAQSAVLARYVSSQAGRDDDHPGTTVFQVQRVAKSPNKLTAGSKLTLNSYHQGKPGDLFLLLGLKVDDQPTLEWTCIAEFSQASFDYVSRAPSSQSPPAKRVEYFIRFLEAADSLIANDAYSELANSEYKDIEALSAKLPKAKIRQWIADPKTSQIRLGLYGMLLGLCGNEADAKFLEDRILVKTEELRLGVDGCIGGYLLIRGERGLDVIDRHILQDQKLPFSERFAAMQALRFMWTYGNGRINPDRLRHSMRILLDDNSMTDLVVADLARWKDWSVQPRLLQLYDEPKFATPTVKRAIVRFLLVSAKDDSPQREAGNAQHVEHAIESLKVLRKKDPRLVADAERFFVVP